MKKLVTLISTKGKTVEEITKQTWQAFKKPQKINQQTKDNINTTDADKNRIVDVTLEHLGEGFII